MWKSACVGVYQLLNWKMHGETLKLVTVYLSNMSIMIVPYFHNANIGAEKIVWN